MNKNKNLDKETIKQYLRNNFERIFNEYKENQESKEMYFFSKGFRIRTAYIADGTYTILGSFLENDYTKQKGASNLSQVEKNKIAVEKIYAEKGNKYFEDCVRFFDYDMEEFDFDSEKEDFCIKYLLDKKVTYKNIDKEIVDLFLNNFEWGKLVPTDEIEFSEIFGYVF